MGFLRQRLQCAPGVLVHLGTDFDIGHKPIVMTNLDMSRQEFGTWYKEALEDENTCIVLPSYMSARRRERGA